ncbi:Golgi apparatus protein 1 [Microplitis demolitor]|uniref:Golgi apparatus protein 1 n=1 Tax=Microplitis demolitor TaxID=69319 RepID=UPI0004CD4B78|nr:Golgi apparatus protein 1 [Microplitis demolitor]
MEYSTIISRVRIRFIYLFISVLFSTHCCVLGYNDVTIEKINSNDNFPQVQWIFYDKNLTAGSNRIKRSPVNAQLEPHNFIEDPKCREDVKRLCGAMDNNNDDLFMLECVQTFKPNEVAAIDEKCQHDIWKHIVNLTKNENIQRLLRKACGDGIDELQCSADKEPGSYLACLIEKRENVKDQQCSEYIQRLEWIAFSDFRIVTPMVNDCQRDIDKFKCGRIQPYREISQGQILACLQVHIEELNSKCKKRILKVSEIQADNIKLDRQLYMACRQDHIRFCSNIRPGSGQVYKCLMQYKFDRAMTKQCHDQLTRRERLISSDYKISKGLAKACKEDIKNNHCRKYVSDDKEIRLAQILLCLESAFKNGSKIDPDCQREMFDHRKMLMEDYSLSPEIVDSCAKDISDHCNGLKDGGVTIHCLMKHIKTRKKGSQVSVECQRAVESLIKETDAGEDWRVDPVLREACQPVVDSSCRDVTGGNARVIYCLMDKLGTDRMLAGCEAALIQIQYFVARDYKLDPQLYKACKADAVQLCSAKTAWSDDGSQMDPERGPLILPCLYRYAHTYNYNNNFNINTNSVQKKNDMSSLSLRPECLEEIRRVMRQRAISVDLQPEIEQACFNELATYCYDKTGRGEEVLCLQDNFERLSDKCKQVIGNLTQDQAERVELNPVIMSSCQRVMEKYCEDVYKYGKDEGDMMECLIDHKNDLDHFEYKCKAAIEHFQLISLQNYHFTYKFMKACKPHVDRWCQKATTKSKVIECLSTIVHDDIVKESQHRILKDCRQQLRAQLYQQRENIRLDVTLQKACAGDIQQLCNQVEPGNAQVLECLASKKNKLSESCHKQLFKVRQQDFQDSSSDFLLLNTCRSMMKQYCLDDNDKSKALECLKRWKDEPAFDEKCKNVVLKRMIEQNTDYRFNVALQSSCSRDIVSHCQEVLNNQPIDKELEGKVINCLKIKFREGKLNNKCMKQMTVILRQAALNYHLNPLLATLCAQEIETICHADDDDPGKVEECLKLEFNNNNPEMKEECRVEIANLIEEAKADIHIDPLLQKACSVDIVKYCSDIPQGNGRHIGCLQTVMGDTKKSLQPDCHKMLSTRIEMFKNAAKLHLPNSIQELYSTVNQSPSRKYFIIVALTMTGIIFIAGLFCGRVTRRTMRMMKNK